MALGLPSPAALRSPVASAARSLVDRAVMASAADRPVFVGGCPRSGTTLVRSMLNAHPSVALPRETHFALEAYRARHEFGDLTDPGNRRELARWITHRKETQFKRLGLEREEALHLLSQAPPTVGSVVGAAFELFADRYGKPRWGDKRPSYVQHLPALFEMFPDAQFVVIVRDPRAVVASMKKLGWLDSWYDGTVAGAVDRWLLAVRRGRQGLRRYRRDQITEIRYEDLVADPTGVLEHLCGFLHLSPDGLDAMLQFHRGGTDIPARQQSRYHPRLMQPISAVSLRAWDNVLTLEEIAFIEDSASRDMARYGYEPQRNGVAIPTELYDSYANFHTRWKARPRWSGRTSPGPRTHPVAARLTTAQRRRHAILRALRLER